MNAYILYRLIKQMRKVLGLKEGEESEAWKIEGGGILFSVLKRMFRLIDRYGLSLPLNSAWTRLIKQTLENVSVGSVVWARV